MRARTSVVVDGRGRLARLDCQSPLTVRQVHAERCGTCALCLVGTAAGPLAGDDFELDLTVRSGGHATLRAAGASLAQGTGGTRSTRTLVTLGADATLTGRPQTVIVGHRGEVAVSVGIDLADGAAIDWSELVVLGRSNEPPGAATLRWDVTRAGRPVLRQFVDLADPELAAWAGMADGARVVATTLISDPGHDARTVVRGRRSVAARLDAHTALLTVLGADAAGVERELRALRDAYACHESPPASGIAARTMPGPAGAMT